MPRTVEAIFEGGVLKPISPLNRKCVTGEIESISRLSRSRQYRLS